MNKLTIVSVFLFVSFLMCRVMAQSPWILQHANGLEGTTNPSIVLSAVNEDVCWGISTNNSQFLRTTDGGTNWSVSTITAEILNGSSISALDANTAWAAMKNPSLQTGGIFKTTDGGLSWTKNSTIFTGSGAAPNLIHFFDADGGICVGDPRGNPLNWEIYTTSDGGNVWTKVPSGVLPPPLTGELGIQGMPVSVGNTFWFATLNGSLYRTTDRGITWSVTRDVMGDQDGFGFTFKDNLNGLACTSVSSNKVSSTSDGGTTWTRIIMNPPGLNGISPVYVSNAKGSNSLYIITSHSNSGGTPTSPGSAYSNNLADWVHIDYLPHGKIAFASERIGWSAGPNDSIYKWDSNLLPTAMEDNNNKVESFSMAQNYPNPFNPTTSIQFQIPEASFVSLKVYDILGNEVADLLNEEKPAGSYDIKFNPAGLSGGVYLYKLNAGGFSKAMKMILLK